MFSKDISNLQKIKKEIYTKKKKTKQKQSRDGRDKSYDGLYRVPTLREYLATAQEYQATKKVGVYPELKQPSYFNEYISEMEGEENRFEDRLLDVLMEFGYR